MRLRRLALENYRNYRRLDMELPGDLYLFVGANAQGKTNLLEAVYLLATGGVARAQRDGEAILRGSGRARVKAWIERDAGPIELEVVLEEPARKLLRRQGQPVSRAGFLGNLAAVSFTPDDLQFVKGPPADRRRFLDVLLCQASPVYRRELIRYQRILRQRNHLLRGLAEGRGRLADLDPWNEQLVEAGAAVMTRRQRAVGRLSELAAGAHGRLTQGGETLSLHYRPGLAEGNDLEEGAGPAAARGVLAASVEAVRGVEVRRGQTLVGPQRDDLLVAIGGQDARGFASQGQQRTAVLACKLAELRYLEECLSEQPVLLLDDVLSELDPARRGELLTTVEGSVQTFLTATDLLGLPAALKARARVLRVQQGSVLPAGRD